MLNRTYVVALVALLGIFVTPASSQTIAEYGAVISTSSTGVAATGSTIRKPIKLAGDALGNKMSQSQPRGVDANKLRTDTPTLEAVMRANKQKLESAAGANGATVKIVSVPTQTAIYIDGLVVAYAPTDIRVPAGKHLIELQRPAFLAWRSQLLLAAGETIHLEPKLTPDPKQVIVSFK